MNDSDAMGDKDIFLHNNMTETLFLEDSTSFQDNYAIVAVIALSM